MSDSGRPNILYLMPDQQKAFASSVNGNPRVMNPFMNEMAAQGTAFMDCYESSPVCTPSCTSVFTGEHPLVHRVTCLQNRAPYDLPQMSEILEDAGYHTVAVGHYEHDRNLTRGWHEQISFLGGGPVAQTLHRWYGSGRSDAGSSSGTIDTRRRRRVTPTVS